MSDQMYVHCDVIISFVSFSRAQENSALSIRTLGFGSDSPPLARMLSE